MYYITFINLIVLGTKEAIIIPFTAKYSKNEISIFNEKCVSR